MNFSAAIPGNVPGMVRRFGRSRLPQFSRKTFAGLLRFAFAFFLVAAMTGCGVSEPPADLVIINGPEPESLDPAIQTGQADGRVVGSLFEGLTRYDPATANPQPGLAERWEISPDERTFTFFLRTNAAWSTGEPITAEDVVYSWLRLLKPETGCEYVGLLFYINNAEAFNSHSISDPAQVGIHALDARTIRVELAGPTAFFLDLCATPTLAIVHRATIEKFGDRWLVARPLPVSGAYELASWRLNDKIRLRKNPRYWDAANTQSEIVDLLPCTLASTALNLYQTGAADIVWDKELVPNELLDVVLKRPDFHAFNYLGTYFFRFNVTRKPFDDPRVRKALALAINKRRLVEKFTRAGERIADHYVPDGTGTYHSPAGLGYDPAAARRLLADAGFPGGRNFPAFHYLYNANGKIHEQIALELQEMWKQELGLNLDLRKLEWKVYLTTQSKTDFDLCRSSWIGDYTDPNTFLDMFMSNNGNNRTGWKNARYDQLVRDGNQQSDPVAREKLLRSAEEILVKEELPVVPLYFYAGVNYWDPATIHGIANNIRDEHPIRVIRKQRIERRAESVERRGP